MTAPTPAAAGAAETLAGKDWRLTPARLRGLLDFLEELEQNPIVEHSMMIAGYYRPFCAATAALRANQAELSVGLAAREVKRRPGGQAGS